MHPISKLQISLATERVGTCSLAEFRHTLIATTRIYRCIALETAAFLVNQCYASTSLMNEQENVPLNTGHNEK